MQPETKSSNEFVDKSESADMSEDENEQFNWIENEFGNSKDLKENEDDSEKSEGKTQETDPGADKGKK